MDGPPMQPFSRRQGQEQQRLAGGNTLPGLDAVYDWFNSNLGTIGLGFGTGGQGGAGFGLPTASAPASKPRGGDFTLAGRWNCDVGVGDGQHGASDRRSASPSHDLPGTTSWGSAPNGGPGSLSGTGSQDRKSSREPTYQVDKEDLLDQHVGYYFRHHPKVFALHRITRKRTGVYDLDGREIKVEWQYATEPGAQGFLVVVDGPLRQPFANYMEMTETNAEYDSEGIGSSSALQSIPKAKRMSFHDEHKTYSRLEAMKVAKEQALVRERAADYVKDGQDIPRDLLHKYKKTIQQKLDPGGRRRASAAAAAERQQATDPALATEPHPVPGRDAGDIGQQSSPSGATPPGHLGGSDVGAATPAPPYPGAPPLPGNSGGAPDGSGGIGFPEAPPNGAQALPPPPGPSGSASGKQDSPSQSASHPRPSSYAPAPGVR
eukprot:CAMPEP_0180467292 /NCGR_PEP_ID=MMETSP1036_2-20121128/26924_1 /TAXON_ID=632150 /ORGANISM="Azadinium spinosum, Strain 3D9" /LENGTH=432 /DNA_ID=CAMNT_0022474249 /DNA_START=1 /DNA_END=1296 /DNA_ORIENTATION=+